MYLKNEGFDSKEINKLRGELKQSGKPYKIIESEDNSEEYVNFYFIGMYEGREVIYDAVIYTLRLHHSSELYEIAEHKAAQKFPNYKTINYNEDENGNMAPLSNEEEEIGLFMAEVIADLEEEETVKVSEHVEIDLHHDYGIGLDIGLNVEVVDDTVIRKFIKEYNDDTLKLDKTLYSFMSEDDEDFDEED
ncbi:hypothetical protein [Penaeicola halotolerans]|uniref:hypothetical protein n=1 Tax=Penaeicola halotolerans TaxID=2793196 RepID=UPI001CF81784|nr:hypothetical protein [Penaeicola halotolerans]